MPTFNQLLTEPVARGGSASVGLGIHGLGSSNYASLRTMFPGSPAYDGTYGDVQVVAGYEAIFVSPISDEGHTFGTVNIDWEDSPDLSTVVTGGGGLPATPYGPNPASPGPGMNYRNIPVVPADRINPGSGGYGIGDGLTSPSETAPRIGRQRIGNLIFGSSTPR